MIWLIGLGGTLGAAARYLLSNFINKKKPIQFSWGTWLINISGSFLLGLLASLHQSNEINDWFWMFAGVGFCGSYTTFSTFGYETLTLLLQHKRLIAGLYVFTSVIVSIITAAIGYNL